MDGVTSGGVAVCNGTKDYICMKGNNLSMAVLMPLLG